MIKNIFITTLVLAICSVGCSSKPTEDDLEFVINSPASTQAEKERAIEILNEMRDSKMSLERERVEKITGRIKGLDSSTGGVSVQDALIAEGFSAYNRQSLEDKARLQMTSIKQAVNGFYMKTGQRPQTIPDLVRPPVGMSTQKWSGPYLEGGQVPTDPWGEQFRLQILDNGNARQMQIVIISNGPNGIPGDEDDLSNTPLQNLAKIYDGSFSDTQDGLEKLSIENISLRADEAKTRADVKKIIAATPAIIDIVSKPDKKNGEKDKSRRRMNFVRKDKYVWNYPGSFFGSGKEPDFIWVVYKRLLKSDDEIDMDAETAFDDSEWVFSSYHINTNVPMGAIRNAPAGSTRDPNDLPGAMGGTVKKPKHVIGDSDIDNETAAGGEAEEAKPHKKSDDFKGERPYRMWKDAAGKFTCIAKFIKVKDSVVTLEKENGKIVNVPLSVLCESDQEFVRVITSL